MYLATAATVALATVVFGGTPAGAQITSCTGQTASPAAVSAGTINAGDSLVVTGGGFAPNQSLSIGLAQPPVVLATVASNTNGDYQTTITTPVTTPSGQNQIIVFGRGPNGTCHQSIALFNVIARPVPQPVAPPVQVIQQPVIQQPVIITQAPTPVVVAGPAPIVKAPLARTGSTSTTLGIAGFATLLAGVALVAVSRPSRRRLVTS